MYFLLACKAGQQSWEILEVIPGTQVLREELKQSLSSGNGRATPALIQWHHGNEQNH